MTTTRSIAVAVVAAVAAITAACSSSGGKTGATSKASKAATTASVAHQLGSKDASADVTLGKIAVDPTISVPSVPVTVTNHSSKRSNYIIELSLESADGKTQIDSTTVAVENLEPGQVSKQTGQFLTTSKLPAGARVVLKSVDRLAS